MPVTYRSNLLAIEISINLLCNSPKGLPIHHFKLTKEAEEMNVWNGGEKNRTEERKLN